MYYLLFALVATKRDAYDRREALGDIRPGNVFISSQETVKFGSLYSFPDEKTNYEKFINKGSPSYKVYLAPEDLRYAS